MITILGYSVSSSFAYSLLLLLLSVLLIIYKHLTSFKYWSNQNVKSPKPWPLFGNNLDLLLKPGLTVLQERYKKFGPIYGIYSGSQPHLVLGDPQMLKEALVKDWQTFLDRVGHDFADGNPSTDLFMGSLTGDEWKSTRSVISPTFTSRKMKNMFNIMNDCCQLLVQNIKKKIDGQDNGSKDGLVIDLTHPAGCYSMDVIAKCCFATETNSFDDPDDVFVENTKNFFRTPIWKALIKVYTPGYLRKFFGFSMFPKNSVRFLEHVSRTVLNKRLSSSNKMKKMDYDYMQLLIEASRGSNNNENDEDMDNYVDNDNEAHHGHEQDGSHIMKVSKKRQLSTDEIIANSIAFLAVGYDTTSLLVSCTIHNLTINPQIQEKLYQELKDAYSKNGNMFDYETVSGLKYLDAVISESLRLYPPATQIERKVVSNYTFSNGITVPKGGSIWLPIWNLHHDSRYWIEPEKFDPERFLPENRDKIVPYAYLPFGAGPRNCIGMRFALLEAKLGVANLVINLKFTISDKTDVPLDISKTSVLLAPKSVFVNIIKRE